MCRCLGILLAATLLAAPLQAGGLTGYIALNHRQYFSPEQFPGQKSNSIPSLMLEPEYYYSTEDRSNSYVAKLFLHLDPVDSERSHFDIRQADWTHFSGDWEFRAGVSRVFWGVAESRHLVDIINQIDLVEDLDEEERLGQPMLQVATFRDWGSIRVMYLPYFREQTAPGVKGRLRGQLAVATDDASYEQGAKEFYPNFAFRYEHSSGNWDMGLAQFHGTGREPNLSLQGGRLIPYYSTINQTSMDLQYTEDAWLWKLEALYRSGHGKGFTAATAGVEYTFFGVADSDHDLGLLLEYSYDGRSAAAPSVLYDEDLFLGTRYVLNNIGDTTFLAGAVIDMEGDGVFALLEFSHRIGTRWKIDIDGRLFNDFGARQPFNFLDNDDYVQLRLSYYF